MITIIAISFLTLTILWLVHWAVIRPIMLDSVERELLRMKSTVDWSIIDELPHSQSFQSQALAKSLECPRCVRHISIGPALYILIKRRAEIRTEEARQRDTFQNSPGWMRDLIRRNGRITMKAALANSPTWWIPLSAVLLGAYFSIKISEFLQEFEIAAEKSRTERPALPNPA